MQTSDCTGVCEPTQWLEVDGVSLAVARVGSGPSVICLHAIGHGGRDFEAFVAAVAVQFDVICLDWPGQGQSGADHQPLSIARYASLLEGVVQQLNIVDPIIIGCSIGGTAAILYAHSNPVRALVLCNSGGLVPYSRSVHWFCSLLARFFASGAKQATWFPFAFRQYYRLVLPSPRAAAQRARITARYKESAPILCEAWREFATARNDLTEIVPQLRAPILVAWAMQDRILTFGMSRKTIRRMRNVEVKKFVGGHAAFLEQPAVFARVFRNFADTIPGAPGESDKSFVL